MNKNIVIGVLAAAVVLLGVFLFLNKRDDNPSANNAAAGYQQPPQPGTAPNAPAAGAPDAAAAPGAATTAANGDSPTGCYVSFTGWNQETNTAEAPEVFDQNCTVTKDSDGSFTLTKTGGGAMTPLTDYKQNVTRVVWSPEQSRVDFYDGNTPGSGFTGITQMKKDPDCYSGGSEGNVVTVCVR